MMDRRHFIKLSGLGLVSVLAGCQTTPDGQIVDPFFAKRIKLLDDGQERFALPEVDLGKFNPAFYPQRVSYRSGEPVGTIIVHTPSKFLYLQETPDEAIRYAIGVGREGFEWQGNAYIQRKAKWPTWTPPSEMIAREPELEKYRNGMEPGLENPLGARALYLYQNGRDTLYRIHGTNQPWSIGKALSSGCIRLLNQHVIDLYQRVPTGTKVVVQQA